MSVRTRAVLFTAPGHAELTEVDCGTPELGQVLIAAELSLISPGTERAFLLGLPNTSGSYPQRPGYNLVGTVRDVGDGVGGLAPGDRVVAAAGHAALAVVSAERVVALPDGVAGEEAVFFNMVAIALQGVRRARIELGESVLVLGQGLVGLLAVSLARLDGGAPVVAVDTQAARLRHSAGMGADRTVEATGEAALDALRESLDGGAAVVLEATGSPEPVNTAFQLAAAHGRVVLLASTRGETERVNFYRDVHRKGLVVYGAHAAARPAHDARPGVWSWRADVAAALRLLALGRLSTAPLVSHRFAAADAADAYELLASWDPGLVGMLLDWRSA